MVASEYKRANIVLDIIKLWQISDLNKEIRNVCPGAEKNTPEIEKIKNIGLYFNNL